jgi:hypothetical protein
LSKYYIALAGERRGPFTLEELQNQALTPDTPLWHAGMTDSLRAEQMPEVKQLLDEMPPPLPPPATPSVTPQALQVSLWDDYLIAHPKLPKMAQLICLYALVLSPALWAINNAICTFNPPWADSHGASLVIVTLVAWVLSLGTTALLFIGGVKLRKRDLGGISLLKLGFTLDWVGTAVGIVLGIIVAAMTPEQAPERMKSHTGLDVIQVLLSLAAMTFELIGLIWLVRTKRFAPDGAIATTAAVGGAT